MTEKTIEQLRKLYKEDFSLEHTENPYLVEFEKRVNDLDKKTVREFAKILSIFKSRFMEQTLQIFPMGTDEQNYRNGVVIEISKVIRTLQEVGEDRPDPVFRDKGKLRSELTEKNSKL